MPVATMILWVGKWKKSAMRSQLQPSVTCTRNRNAAQKLFDRAQEFDLWSIYCAKAPASLRSALQAVAPSLSSYSYDTTLFNFIGEVESEAGKTLTDDEAGQLIRAAHLVGRVFTFHF